MSVSPAELAGRFAQARADPALVVLEGFHALKHALRFGASIEAVAAVDPAGLEALADELAPDLAGRLGALATPVEPAALRELSAQPHHTGVVAIARRPPAVELAAVRRDAPVVLLEDPRRLGNVGAVVRVAAAADVAAVVTTGRADPWDPAALRGSAGLHFALPVERLGERGGGQVGEGGAGASRLDSADPLDDRPLLALDPDGEPLRPGAIPPDAVLAFGTERHGLSADLLARADRRLALPMRAGVSSLNLATAVAAVLFARQLAR